jgi:hypothetical protein
MIPIVEETCERAWLAAATYLAEPRTGHMAYNLVVEISKPSFHDDVDLRVRAVLDSFLRRHEVNPVGCGSIAAA